MTLRSCFLGEGLRSDKFDVRDFDLRTFLDLERGRARARCFRRCRCEYLTVGLGVAGLLVHLLDFLAVGEKLPFVERLADFGGDFLQQLCVLVLFVALEFDCGQPRVALEDVGQTDAIRRPLVDHADVVKLAGRVESADVVIDRRAGVRVSPTLTRMLARISSSLTEGGPMCLISILETFC